MNVEFLKVKVTYEVVLGDLDIPEKEYNELKELNEDFRELDGSGIDKYTEAREWLNCKIKESDCQSIKYEIEELE